MIFDLSAETSVLGAILIDNNVLDDVKASLYVSDFHDHTNQKIYKAMLELETIDTVTLDSHTGGNITSAILALGAVPTAAGVITHVRMVKECSHKRKILSITDQMKGMTLQGMAGAEEIISTYLDNISKIETIKDNSCVHIREILPIVMKDMANKDISEFGIPSFIGDLDKLLGCFYRSDLNVIAARPGMGKTALALTIAYNMAKHEPVMFFSLEMRRSQIAARLLCMEHNANLQDINLKENLADNIVRVHKGAQILHDLPFYLDDKGGLKVEEFESRIKKAVKEYGIKATFIDYLQLMDCRKNTNNESEYYGYISKNLKRIAKEVDIPIILLSQLNRKCENRDNKRPMLSDLRSSGQIEQDADIVIFIYRDEMYNPDTDDKGIAEIAIAKARNASTGRVKLVWLPDSMQFKSLEYRHDY